MLILDLAERTQNWFGKPFSGKMTSWNDDSNHKPEQVLAVAAAAATYVINSIAEPNIQDQKKTSAGLGPSLTRDKSRKEDKSFSTSKPGTVSKQLSGKGSTKGSGSAESKVAVPDGMDDNETKSALSLKRPLTFADYLGNTSITKQRSSSKPDMFSSQTESAAPKPDVSTIKPASTAPKPDHPAIKPGTAAGRPEEPPTIEPRPETEQAKAEDWEKDEMAKIKERYKKLNSTILAWEEKKKKKAKNKLDRTEKLIAYFLGRQSGLERKRARALLKFKNEMEYIKQAVDGARAQAEASQKNDELKAKEKANITRKTGEVPRKCFCC
ncbi:microtubule-associated tumor suppressor candidate 2-like [Gossypium australe]|uniref:Microtubule-associated tumor suppressor candidate 2-like n=1 Tax=Gossypium australe TaxID=47621 RepID=A0A5B6X371_9ROSI|nr:microtubule-associated tumor suppressor candidate 2-like [Gossypium australe]